MKLAAPFHPKARKWVQGRRGIFDQLEKAIKPGAPVIWMHCASLGEFEQGRPVIEKLRQLYPTYRILLTFFSPSGYEVQKNYAGVDWVFYLPMDGPRRAKRFLSIVQPSLVIFVKYEFWFYYLKKIKYRNIPLLLVSALFRKDMSFFKWYGALQRKMLSRFDHLFVQTAASKHLVDAIGLADITSVSGDTRFDRVIEIANTRSALPLIEKFAAGNRVIVAGSTWPGDEVVLQHAWNALGHPGLKMIIAPHEIDAAHLSSIRELFPGSVLYSTWKEGSSIEASVLVIDNFGMLSQLYAYATISYVGGGLRSTGVHNTLEAAVYGKPVLFGSYYEKYIEAVDLVACGGGLAFPAEKNAGEELTKLLQRLLNDPEMYQQSSRAAADFVSSHGGATNRIIRFIQEKRLLTS